MAKPLNYNNLKKKYLSVTLADENNTVLLVGMPTKSIMDELTSLEGSIETLDADSADLEALDDMYRVCAKIMSRNKCGIKITKEYLEDVFDYEDITIFLDAYTNFIGEISSVKN